MNSLETYLKDLLPHGIALAFSGGVDSALLLHVLVRLRQGQDFPLSAFFFQTPFQTPQEEQAAGEMARKAGVDFTLIPFDPLQLPALRFNPPNRCYLCKKELFVRMKRLAEKKGLHALLDGTNADDLNTYRPGLQALRELGVFSPLAQLGFRKSDVRALAKQFNLPCADKPSAPCLATRFEYGAELTPQHLHRVAAAEERLRQFYPEAPLRVRIHGDLARIELPQHLLPQAAAQSTELCSALAPLGFHHITLDLQGFRSGSMDIALISK